MKTIASLFQRLANEEENVVNPSLVLRINRDQVTGSLELTNLSDEFPSPLKISWIRKDTEGKMKPVWVSNEHMVM
jgi:hypothetical protein